MKTASRIVVFAGLISLAGAAAFGQPAGSTFTFTGGITGGGTTTPYGTGYYPRLQTALVDLYSAQEQLGYANAADKADYLPRAILGVQTAIADVKRAADNSDGLTPPPVASLPSLPAGVGNPSSGLVIVPTATPKVPSPFMDSAIASLNDAQSQLKAATPGGKGDYLPRAIVDVAFAIDNANAAVNAANGLRPSQPNVAPSPDPANPGANLSVKEIGGALLAVIILLAIGVEHVLRGKGRW
jgi:hypothetical protein